MGKLKRKVGRPSKKDGVSLRKVLQLASFGLTEAQVAAVLDVNALTIYRYKLSWEQFCNAIKKGKEIADSKVVKSLYQRAMGYSYKEVTREPKKEITYENGQRVSMEFNENKLVITKEITKEVVPDVTAQIFWLKNRQAEDWKDRVVTIDGKVPIEEDLVFTGVPKKGTGNGKFKRFYN